MAFKSSKIPQSNYFQALWSIPGTDWTISGHSRALERTGFWIPELRIVLDGGVDLPTDAAGQPSAIFITHGHIDHINALPMLLRHARNDNTPLHLFAPAQILHRLREFSQLSFSVKVDDGNELPLNYQPPQQSERTLCLECYSGENCGTTARIDDKVTNKVWHAVLPDSSTEVAVGKKNKTKLTVHTLQLYHGICTSVGYLLSTPPSVKKKLRPELIGANQKETSHNIRAAKRRGEDPHITQKIPEKSYFAFVLDTTIEALNIDTTPTAQRILSCPVVMIECTYLEDSMGEEAERRGHVHWRALLPFVLKSRERYLERKRNCVLEKDEQQHHQTWVLVHFSLRYSEQDILNFFLDRDACRLTFSLEHIDAVPADVVLWFTSGPRELWILKE